MSKKPDSRLKLHGFNNLTKSLSFNMYDICYASTVEDRDAYISYIDEQYNSERLTHILVNVSSMIGACVLNIAKQDYDPQGASVTILICEGSTPPLQPTKTMVQSETVVAHLDKSHITVHTYPEYHPDGGVCTFRADIDVSTCGEISPLKALNYLIQSFEADIMTLDYRVRGFTRDITGQKHYIDHEIESIQDYIPDEVADKYQLIDVNVYQENIFHTKALLKDFELDNYLFGISKTALNPGVTAQITRKLKKEMDEIFSGRNFSPYY